MINNNFRMGNWFSRSSHDTADLNAVNDALAKKFIKVKVNRREVEMAESTIDKMFFEHWTESMSNDVSTGISKDKIGEFGMAMAEVLGLQPGSKEDKTLKANLRKITISEGAGSINAHSVMEMDFHLDAFKSVYGFMCAIEQRNGNVAIAYAFHSLNFKISVNEMGEQVKLGFSDIQCIKNTFSKHKALMALKDEGIIPFINYDIEVLD